MARGKISVLLCIVILNYYTATSQAQQPLVCQQHLVLQEIEIINCEELNEVNIMLFTSHMPQEIYKGAVLQIKLLRERSVLYDFWSGNRPCSVSDWEKMDSNEKKNYFYQSDDEGVCNAFAIGSKKFVQIFTDQSCDTVPAVGLCIFHGALAEDVMEKD